MSSSAGLQEVPGRNQDILAFNRMTQGFLGRPDLARLAWIDVWVVCETLLEKTLCLRHGPILKQHVIIAYDLH